MMISKGIETVLIIIGWILVAIYFIIAISFGSF